MLTPYTTEGMKVCEALGEALRRDATMTEMIEALDAAEIILRHMPNTSTNCGGTKPLMTTHKALQLVRHALKKAGR